MSSEVALATSEDQPVSNTPKGTEPMIEVTGLRKFYGTFEALKGISFTVGRGEIVGLLGPNGAGKTTTMKILTGYISATEGSFRVAGYDGFTQSVELRREIGYLPENAPLYPEMGIMEYLDFVCDIRGIPKALRAERISKMINVCGLGKMVEKDIGELSKGYRQRVGLAQAMIHDPSILILDEPTSGLDPNQIVEIRKLIKELGQDRTIILSTHNLPEVQMTCSRMIIISDGNKVADGTAEELERQGASQSRFILGVVLPESTGADAASTQLQALGHVDSVELLGTTGDVVRYAVTASENIDLAEYLSTHATSSGWSLRELRRDVMDLEKLFHNLTQY